MRPCPACASDRKYLVEQISIEAQAPIWSQLVPGSGEELSKLSRTGAIPKQAKISRCKECGLEFADPPFSVGADWYERFERYGDRWEYHATLAALGDTKATILEIGCGEGYFLEMATRAGHTATGVDYNERAVSCAQAKQLDAQVGDVRSLLAKRLFSNVAFFHVIEHVEDPCELLTLAHDSCEVGGNLFVSCPGPRRFTTPMLPSQRAGLRDVWDYPPFHQTRWNKSALKKCFSRAGWRLTSAKEEPISMIALNAILRSSDPEFIRASALRRKARLLLGLPRALIGSKRYRGMSILATATRG